MWKTEENDYKSEMKLINWNRNRKSVNLNSWRCWNMNVCVCANQRLVWIFACLLYFICISKLYLLLLLPLPPCLYCSLWNVTCNLCFCRTCYIFFCNWSKIHRRKQSTNPNCSCRESISYLVLVVFSQNKIKLLKIGLTFHTLFQRTPTKS